MNTQLILQKHTPGDGGADALDPKGIIKPTSLQLQVRLRFLMIPGLSYRPDHITDITSTTYNK